MLLAAVMWLTHFLHARQFGVYEDDWYRIPDVAGVTFHQYLQVMRAQTFDRTLGRPLHPMLIQTLAYAGLKSGNLFGIYVIGWCIESVNAALFYGLVLRVWRNHRFALLAGLAYCLFPADTTQPFLTHALGVHTALTLLLLAFHAYLSGRKSLSYIVAFTLLFTYEVPFPLFAAAPLLTRASRRQRVRHWVATAAILLFAVIVRRAAGESRVAQVDIRQILVTCSNLITGPLTCLAMYAWRPMETILKLRGWDWALVAVAATGISLLLRPHQQEPVDALPSAVNALRLGVILLVLAYPLTLTTVGIAVSGRGTRVHIAALFGASLLFAWTGEQLLRRHRVAAVGLGVFMALLTGFGLLVQQDYVSSWKLQRRFWTGVMALSPPLRDGDVILVEPEGLSDSRQFLFLRKTLTGRPATRHIHALDDLLPGLPALLEMPASWQQRPLVFRMPLDWQSRIATEDGRLRLLTVEDAAFHEGSRAPVEPSQAVLLQTAGGRLTRATSWTDPSTGKTMQLRRDPGPITSPRRRAFARYVLLPERHAGESSHH